MTRLRPASAPGADRRGDFAAGWRVLLGSAIGIGVGIIALPIPAIGVFMRDLQADFGWSRAEISLGPTILVLTLAMMAPFLGWIADRVAPRLIVGTALSALAVGLYLFSKLNGELWLYYIGFGALAVAASGSTTIVYARAISSVFHRNRGFALGLAMVGIGLTGVLLPLLLTPYAAGAGWRAGFVVLAGVVAAALPLVILLLGADRPGERPTAAAYQRGGLGDALRMRSFWTMGICFVLIPLAVSGLHLHLLAYLADMGMDPVSAGMIASIGGVSLMAARILTGLLIDRIFAPYVAAFMMGLSALALLLMAVFGPKAAVFGAIAMGVSIGAELDLLGYMAARYFGLERFGRIYGLLYGAILVGSAASPLAYGLIADVSHSYKAAVASGALLLGISAILFMTLPRFAYDTDH